MFGCYKKGLVVGGLVLAFGCLSAGDIRAQTGSISGTVVSGEDGRPLAYANVVVAETKFGAMSFDDGAFRIIGLPPGSYTVTVLMMGYKRAEQADVVVEAGRETRLEFSLDQTIVAKTPVIVVREKRPMVVADEPNVTTRTTGEEMRVLPIDAPTEVAGITPGFVTVGGEMHAQGGRSNEVLLMYNGIPIVNPLGGSTLDISLLGTQEMEVIAGGMDAEYGDAQSAIINITTREGGDRFGGEFRYFTDDFGRQDKTYTNFDRVGLGFGGPTWWRRVRYYVSGEATFSDTENTTLEPRREHKITDWLKFRERQVEAFNFQSKLTYTRSPFKLTGEVVASRAHRDAYFNNWNVEGYVGKIHYFQRLRVIQEGNPPVMQFFGIARVDHGKWAEIGGDAQRARQLNIRPVVVVQEMRDPQTGESLERWFYNFRAADIGGQTVVWDEAVTDPPNDPTGAVLFYRPWALFSGFQFPYSEFKPHLRDPEGADSAFVPFNSAMRTPETQTDHVQFNVGFNHMVNSQLLYTIKLSRLELSTTQTVHDEFGRPKRPDEFASAGLPATLPDGTYLPGGVTTAAWYTDARHPYFVTAYDFPVYADQKVVQYLMRGDIDAHQFKGHKIRSGIQLVYNDLADDERVFPAQRRLDSETGIYQQGLNVNVYHNFNTEGALYAQDKWEYEGMVLNGGLRFEFFSTGNNDEIKIHSTEIDQTVDKWKFNLSPRLGVAFPITERDKFFFHYGRFTQWPSRVNLFRTQDPIGSLGTLGNPNLDPMLTVSYQAGVAHQFTNDIAGSFIVFNKDIYGLVSSAYATDDTTGVRQLRYVNKTYASARGLEVSIKKRLTRRMGFEVYYTYSFADGVASDADFGRSAEGLTHLPTDELPLDWDQRHTLNVTLRLQDGSSWGASAIYQYGSGLPWTPVDRFARLRDPMWENSRRLEPTHRLRIQGQKRFRVYGSNLTLFVEGRNLLDDDLLLPGGTAPGVVPAMNGVSMDGGAYLTETGRYGGAYLQDTDDDGLDEFNPVFDPMIWEEHRVWRLGFGFEF
jgi:hypothetical protein